MANVKFYSHAIFWYNQVLMGEVTAFSISEKDRTISLTSCIPIEGAEFDPNINEKAEIRYTLMGPPDCVVQRFTDYQVKLLDKKISGSFEKGTFQILLFEILDTYQFTKSKGPLTQ